MKILQIINSLGTGGAEKLLLDTIPLYRKAGIEMDILVILDNDFPFLKVLQDLDCCTVYVLKKSSNYKHIYNPTHIFRIRKILKEYDIAHIHLFPAQYFTVFANILNGNRTKLIFTEHNTSNRRIQNKKYRILERFIYRRYTYLVCITEEIKNIYTSYLGNVTRQIVIQNGVDISKYANATSLFKRSFYTNDDFLLIQVSSFREQKDQKTLIQSLMHLPENVKLLLVGDGYLRKECEQLSTDLNLQNRVKFLGIRTDIPELLKTADVVVLSSIYEGLSLSSIEGMAARPFIASDVPGLRETVKNYGLLFQQGNSEELANHILQLYNNTEFYNKIAHQCLERAKEFDIHKMVDSYIEVYRGTA